MRFKKEDIFTIPNILTYIRLLLVPAFVIVYLTSRTVTGNLWAFGIAVFSALTDVADGIIARKCNMTTDLGKIIDPIADKAMQFAMLFCVVFRYNLVAILIVIYAIKEVVSFAFSSYLFKRGKHIAGANWAGKVCTVVLFLVMFVLIAFPNVQKKYVIILVCVSAAFMLMAFAVYMTLYVRLYLELKREQSAQ